MTDLSCDQGLLDCVFVLSDILIHSVRIHSQTSFKTYNHRTWLFPIAGASILQGKDKVSPLLCLHFFR